MEFTRRSVRRRSRSPSQASLADLNWKGGVQFLGPRSVYGGAGGHGIRISNAPQMVNYDLRGGYLFSGNVKMAMRNLNDRLAIYLEKVRSLEQSNNKLDVKIKQWYETNTSTTSRDYSAYYKQIEELRKQVRDAQMQNAQWVLKVDNANLALEDFRMKYENERGLRLTVEVDIHDLGKVRDDLTLQKTDLEIQIEELNKDLIILKKEHQEEVDSLRKQLGSTVNVELKAAPGLNLSAIMDEMRQKYEALAQENLQKAKEHFKMQTETLQQKVTVETEELKGSEIQMKELRRTYQNVEIDLKSQLSMKEALERTLQGIKGSYREQLAKIQERLNSMEAQIMQIRTDAERQNKEYNELLDIKTQLEQEIATYRRLLEGEDIRTTEHQLSTLEEKIDHLRTRMG
ncbi:keratin, type I cytoskeletal 20 [Rhynchonycteris naso]